MMKNLRCMRFLPGLALLAAISGCATYPISKSLRTSASQDITFHMVQNNPQNFIGSLVIWGGIIIETTNVPGGSEITLLETPLIGMEEPRSAEYSLGRLIAKSGQFLDPAIYKNGRKVTIAGEIAPAETRPLGNTQYTYPVLNVKQLYLWPKEKVYMYEPAYYWDSWPDWPRYEFYYRDRGFGHDEHGEHERQQRHK